VHEHEVIAATYPVSKSVLVKDINDFRHNASNRAIWANKFEGPDDLYEFLISQGWTPPHI
jgi:hypothetical protein